MMLKRYSYDHIVIMTNNFKERLEFEQSLEFVTSMLYSLLDIVFAALLRL